MPEREIFSSEPDQLGATIRGDGVDFAVFSENASSMDLCLFSPDGREELSRLTLPEKTGAVWHGHVPDLPAGTLYGYRAHGPYDPEHGHRFNANKLLLDPYTRELHGAWTLSDAMFGFDRRSPKQDLSFSQLDSAAFVAKSVVSDPALFQPSVEAAGSVPDSDLIYEAHTKGLTMEHPGVPPDLRGTYDGLATDAMIEHYQKLGIRWLELLPIHALFDEPFLQKRGLSNYWGYNSIGFFTPEPRYFGPSGIHGFRKMVEKLKSAGISVLLDVVFNHTAEGDHLGPTLSFRGLDNASYYRLISGQRRLYANDTGCGNTLNMSHPFVLRMVLDCLRFWVTVMGVDGFRFDLATTLGREPHGFDPYGGFFDAVNQDPILRNTCLIAEPWDIGPGGYRLGEFPHPFREWNDRYRDTVRRYWRGDAHSTQELASTLLGSADRFDRSGRRANSSVNFVTSHDGFTLADLTRFNEKHNEANTEQNKDGHHANFSDNCGVEGETDDPVILARRIQRQRNLLATLFLSQGTPMLLAGDEISNSQGGNNNAYCQDNPLGWINRADADMALCEFVARLSEFRSNQPVLRQTRFLHGASRDADGQADVEWFDFNGAKLEWRDPHLSRIALIVRGSAEAPAYHSLSPVFLAFNREAAPARVALPNPPEGEAWHIGIDTAEGGLARADTPCESAVDMAEDSVLALYCAPSQ